jgi:CheY-like chemotaxis protein
MGTPKVVVIDDERDVVTYLVSVLQDMGFDVHAATTANEGLELIRKEHPNVICLDILMPKETGASLYRKVKEDPTLRNIPIVIISGLNIQTEMSRIFGENGGKDIADELKPDAYIEKPVNVPVFLDTIRALTA